jgi:large subunit ribosomal protein L6
VILRESFKVSRIGNAPIVVPQGVEVSVAGAEVAVKGPKGQLQVPFVVEHLAVDKQDADLVVTRKSDEKLARSLHGLTRTLIANAVSGVTEGFFKNLDLFGVGYRAEVQGNKLTLNIGYSHTVVYEAPDGIEIEVTNGVGGGQARIIIKGADKQMVGQVAADIRFKRRPEPYKGKGIRYENEVIHWKQGKAAVG